MTAKSKIATTGRKLNRAFNYAIGNTGKPLPDRFRPVYGTAYITYISENGTAHAHTEQVILVDGPTA